MAWHGMNEIKSRRALEIKGAPDKVKRKISFAKQEFLLCFIGILFKCISFHTCARVPMLPYDFK